MNKIIAATAFILGSISMGVLLADAQPVGPSGGPMGGRMGRPGGQPAAEAAGPTREPGMAQGTGPGMGRGMDEGAWSERVHERRAHRMEMMRLFALFDRPDDKKLTAPDVQKIAEAFLLWNGNHTWKVINVRADGDAIAFDLATAEGSVIAHYTMDPKTGRPARRG